MLLNISDMQAYFSVEPIVLKNVQFLENATILPAQTPLRNKNNKCTRVKN